jgi:hypothetical protein
MLTIVNSLDVVGPARKDLKRNKKERAALVKQRKKKNSRDGTLEKQ